MKSKTILLIAAALNLLFLQHPNAELTLRAIVSSNMVLQRDANITIWVREDARNPNLNLFDVLRLELNL